MARPKRDLVRVNMNLPAHVVDLIDEWASKHGVNRTTAVLILVADGMAAYGPDLGQGADGDTQP